MKKTTLIILALGTAFFLGYAFKSNKENENQLNKDTMKKVTGIGGIFFKCKDPQKMTAWYQKHLGLNTNPYGATFQWYERPDSNAKAQTQWTPFADSSDYFEKEFMINYRVENLVALVEELKNEDVQILDDIQTYDYGKFVHILDAEGNKIELWEPTD